MSSSVYTDFNHLATLRREASQNGEAALEKSARQFEALFVQMMLKSMREAGGGEGLFDSQQSELYRDMYDKQLSLNLTEQGEGLGLAKMLVQQLRRTMQTDTPQHPVPTALAVPPRGALHFELSEPLDDNCDVVEPVSRAATPAVAGAPQMRRNAERFDSPEQFLSALAPHAQRAGERLGLDPRALLAQAALETGWGRAVIRHADGSSSNNLFNIKADRRWEGERVAKQSLEYRQGVAAKELSQFRAYGSVAESFDDYVEFVSRSPRYAEALRQAGDAERYLEALHEAGYATDPGYAEKIKRILNSDVMASAEQALKFSGAQTLT